jgi:hypothetical protein
VTQKNWLFEKKKKRSSEPLAKLTKRRKEKTQINKIRDEKGDIKADTSET